ncbi:MAG: NADH-quinone oxidoreductase subunit M [Deltaproteobacteria bacterium]|nr:NADH-quinone oxidoreductase subunit M [Deltaproteobacteria bacterium]
MSDNLLTAVIFAPLLGVAGLVLLPRRHEAASREIALVTSLVTLVLGGWLAYRYEAMAPAAGFAFAQAVPWIPDLSIYYRIGIDGVSLALILLTVLLTPICVLCSWREITHRRKEFMFLLLLVEVGLNGAFVALDLFLFYVFWEVMLIPMYFLVGIWGGQKRIMAAVKFLLYTMVGSVLMLVAILSLYFTGGKTFNLLALYDVVLAPAAQWWLFLAFALAFAIKVPLFPFHTWLPDAHTEAPTAGSVILAGVFLKVGTYGFYRFAMPLFPDAVLAVRPLILAMAVIGIVGGALVSMVQPDVKRLIAYSSVSHLGFVMLGLFALTPEGVQGAVLQMINHGISTGGLFLLFGMLYERTHTRMIADYGGIGRAIPLYTTCFILLALSSLGLPGLNNFVGEFLVLLGAFRVEPVHAVLSAVGVIIGAVYLLWLVERVFFGATRLRTETGSAVKLADLNRREALLLLPLIGLVVWLGIYPRLVLDRTAPSVATFLHLVQRTQVPDTIPLAEGPR